MFFLYQTKSVLEIVHYQIPLPQPQPHHNSNIMASSSIPVWILDEDIASSYPIYKIPSMAKLEYCSRITSRRTRDLIEGLLGKDNQEPRITAKHALEQVLSQRRLS